MVDSNKYSVSNLHHDCRPSPEYYGLLLFASPYFLKMKPYCGFCDYLQTQVYMKKLLPLGLSFMFALVATVAYAQPKIQFTKTKHVFGTIKEDGGLAQVTFNFKNTGNKPLKLTNVRASCGCTTPKWSKEPIQPGEEGFIDVSFNTTGKMGIQNKSVTVTGNFEKFNKILRISGEVTRE